MISIYFANETLSIDATCSLGQLLKDKGYTHGGYAIALNNQFIPQSFYDKTFFKADDHVEIIVPMQGG